MTRYPKPWYHQHDGQPTVYYTADELDGELSAPREVIEEEMYELWRRGTDWNTTVVKVACILEGEVKCDVHPESYHNKLEDMADEIVATVLTALLGDRPTELESHDE